MGQGCWWLQPTLLPQKIWVWKDSLHFKLMNLMIAFPENCHHCHHHPWPDPEQSRALVHTQESRNKGVRGFPLFLLLLFLSSTRIWLFTTVDQMSSIKFLRNTRLLNGKSHNYPRRVDLTISSVSFCVPPCTQDGISQETQQQHHIWHCTCRSP